MCKFLALQIHFSAKGAVLSCPPQIVYIYLIKYKIFLGKGKLPPYTSDRKHPFSKAPSICKALFAMHHTWIIMILSDDQDNWHIKYPIRRKMHHYIIHPINTQFYWLSSSQIDQTWPVNWCLLSFQEVRSSVVVHCTLDNSESILATSSTRPCILLVTLINKSSTCIFLSGIL